MRSSDLFDPDLFDPIQSPTINNMKLYKVTFQRTRSKLVKGKAVKTVDYVPFLFAGKSAGAVKKEAKALHVKGIYEIHSITPVMGLKLS